MKEILNIVDENDQVIGTAERTKIHNEGLLHRETHIWFYTPKKELIFQHRAKDKDTYPDLLDATVGGHVEIGDDYLATAVKESFEETGIRVNPVDLVLVAYGKSRSVDSITGKINHAFRKVYAYRFDAALSDLSIEKGKAVGFEKFKLSEVLDMEPAKRSRFIPGIFNEITQGAFRKMLDLK